MKKGNSLVCLNISFGKDHVRSVININATSIALCTDKGIEIYKKETQELKSEIPLSYYNQDMVLLAIPVIGIAKDKYLLLRNLSTLFLVNLGKKEMTHCSFIIYDV